MAALNETTAIKKYAYVAPASPANLIDCSNYTLSFTERKFVNIGIDPTDQFAIKIQILTPARYVNITSDILTRIFSLMSDILSFILDTPKYKSYIFLETDLYKLSSMVYKNENVFVIESKTMDGCRILLNSRDLFTLQNLEWCLFETVARKTAVSLPIVLKQFDQIGNYIREEITKMRVPPSNRSGIEMFIKNLKDEDIIALLPKHDVSYVGQIKMYATTQLAECWMQSNLTSSPSYSPMSPSYLSPPTYAVRGVDHNDGPWGPQYIPKEEIIEELDSTVSEMGWGLKR